MIKSFKNLTKLALGASLVASVFMGSVGSTSANQTAASENMDDYLNLNALAAQTTQTNESALINDTPMLRANHVAQEAAISNNGNHWLQPGGFKYFTMHIQNTHTEPLKVYIIEDDVTALLGTVDPKSSDTWVSPTLRFLGKGKMFFLSYTTPSGELSGTVKVRVSNTPF